ncbi:recombinase family protein [Modestobacter sp. VKM Ac-2986]|uniref:recombinase family protein n=1 Tax=Modestobacter sp. VKM Ac-2986 TaxID=3004140 RepID=UPI0022AB7019|nr:recombinase family protein [Modestobacter sp. VKM Ac-2986]MCZ2829131.1 recombinase family protein [Modestobacter sp. VKM Ac-2986]
MVGYARVSTLEEDPALQHDALTAAGAVRVFTDYASGATAARPQLIACLDFLRPGDTLAVWRIDRLGRSVADLTTIVNDLGARGIQFQSLTEAIDTTTVGGELVFHIFAAVAQMERRLISERTRAGLAAARARGRAGGRPTVMTPERLTAAHAMRAQGMTLIQIAATLGVGRSSLVRALAQTPDPSADLGSADVAAQRTVIQLPEQEVPSSPAGAAPALEVQLLGREARRRGEELEALGWPAGYSPACPSCSQPTTGIEEQYARAPGQREPVVVALAQPCGCLIDEHVAALLDGAPLLQTG